MATKMNDERGAAFAPQEVKTASSSQQDSVERFSTVCNTITAIPTASYSAVSATT